MADNPQKHSTPASTWGEITLIKSCQAWENQRRGKKMNKDMCSPLSTLSILSSQAPVVIDVCSHFLTIANNKQALKNHLNNWKPVTWEKEQKLPMDTNLAIQGLLFCPSTTHSYER